MQRVDPATLPALPSIVGVDRFAPYLVAQNGDRDAAVRLYAWNVEAPAGLLGAFAALEVGLRNVIHDSLTATFQEPDWWNSAPLTQLDRDQAAEAESYLERRKGTGA